jgi:hypothetical protein
MAWQFKKNNKSKALLVNPGYPDNDKSMNEQEKIFLSLHENEE